MRLGVFAAVLGAAVCGASVAAAQDPPASEYVGKPWLPKLTCVGEEDGKQVTLSDLWYPLTITKDEGDKVRVANCWIAKSELLPLAEASDYYTKQIANNTQNAWPLCFRSMARQLQGDLDGALLDAEAAVALLPTAGLMRQQRGAVLAAKKDLERALADYDQAVQLMPDHAGVLYARAVLRFDQGNIERATVDCQSSLKIHLANPDALCLLAKCFDVQEGLAQAVECCRLGLKFEPQSVRFLHHRAELNRRLGNLDAALQDATELVRVAPSDIRSYLGRSVVLAQQQRFDLAIEDIDRALRIDPQLGPAYRSRAEVNFARGDKQQGLADIERAIQLEPGNAEYYSFRGIFYADQGLSEQAIADFSKAIELNPKLATPWHNRAALLRDEGRLDEACRDQAEAIRLDDRSVVHYLGDARNWALKRDFSRALARCDEALLLDPRSAAAYLRRGQVRLVAGDFERAKKDVDQALTLDAHVADGNWVRAVTLASLSHWKKAEDVAVQTADASQLDSEAFALVTRLRQFSGRIDEAIEFVDRVAQRAPDWAEGKAVKAALLLAKGDATGARTLADEALVLSPKCSTARRVLAELQMRAGQKRAAFDTLSQVVRADRKDCVAYFDRGLIRMAYGQQPEALRELNTALERFCAMPEAYLWRAEAQLASRDTKSALADLELAERMLPTDPRAALRQALVYAAGPQESMRHAAQALACASRGYKLEKEKTYWSLEAVAAAYAAAADYENAQRWQAAALKRLSANDPYRAQADRIAAGYARRQAFPWTAAIAPTARPRREHGALFAAPAGTPATSRPVER